MSISSGPSASVPSTPTLLPPPPPSELAPALSSSSSSTLAPALISALPGSASLIAVHSDHSQSYSERSSKRKESSLSRLVRSLSLKKRTQSSSETSTQLAPPPLEPSSAAAQTLSAEIEKAAVDRDEQRKRRVGEALSSVHRRLDVASETILAEMDDAMDRSRLSVSDKTVCLMCVVGSLLAGGVLACILTLALGLKMALSSRQHVSATADANDDVAARLQDLDDGIRRCELALELDIKAEAEWAQEMEDERRTWEERQRQLSERRGPRKPSRNPTVHRIRERSKLFMEKAKQDLERTVHNLETKVHRPIDAAKSMLPSLGRRGQFGHAGSGRVSRPSSNEGEFHTEPGASDQWIKYVNSALPIERNPDKTPEEREFEREILKRTSAWERVPTEIQLMVLRGYADKKDRLELSVEGTNYIADWRDKVRADQMLDFVEPAALNFFKSWPTRFGGEDRFGHPVVYDRVEEFNIGIVIEMDETDFLRFRTQQLEVIQHVKQQIGNRTGHRVSKHIYIMDLKGLSLQKHFTRQVKNVLQPIFKIAGDAYPDSLWAMWLVNVPMVFRVIWNVIAPAIDPVVKAKIRMMSGKEQYLREMEKCGLMHDAVPLELGGSYPGRELASVLEEICKERRESTEA